jgi:DNA-binding NtrC family response regulator
LPALRQRGQDILLLAQFFLLKFVKEEQKDFQGFSAEAENKLLNYEWPGNVRQLQNTIHNAVLLNRGKVVTVEMLSTKINENLSDKNTPLPTKSIQQIESVESHCVAITEGDTFRSFKEIEKEVILAAIKFCGGNVVKAAEILKMSQGTVYNKLRRWKDNAM